MTRLKPRKRVVQSNREACEGKLSKAPRNMRGSVRPSTRAFRPPRPQFGAAAAQDRFLLRSRYRRAHAKARRKPVNHKTLGVVVASYESCPLQPSSPRAAAIRPMTTSRSMARPIKAKVDLCYYGRAGQTPYRIFVRPGIFLGRHPARGRLNIRILRSLWLLSLYASASLPPQTMRSGSPPRCSRTNRRSGPTCAAASLG